MFYLGIHFKSTLPETNSSPQKIGQNPKWKDRLSQVSILRCELLFLDFIQNLHSRELV